MKVILRIVVLLIIVSAILFIRGRIVKLASKIKSLETEKIKMEQEIDSLRKKLMEMEKIENIEKLARKKGIIK